MTLNPVVSVEWLSNNLDIPNLVILDASTKKNVSNLVPEFPNIQIKNARHFDMENTFFDSKSNLPNMIPSPEVFQAECQKLGIQKNSIIIIYDNLGIYTSPRAWWMFKAMGHQYVSVLNGGLSAWKNAGMRWEKLNKKNYKTGDFEANYQPDLVRDSNYILSTIDKENVVIVDARSNDRFTGEASEPRAGMESGHIPNSINLPYKNVLDGGCFKSKAALTEIFENLDLGDQELVFTCGSGITACIILLASELVANNQKALFDGSWSEWGQQGKFPVAR